MNMHTHQRLNNKHWMQSSTHGRNISRKVPETHTIFKDLLLDLAGSDKKQQKPRKCKMVVCNSEIVTHIRIFEEKTLTREGEGKNLWREKTEVHRKATKS